MSSGRHWPGRPVSVESLHLKEGFSGFPLQDSREGGTSLVITSGASGSLLVHPINDMLNKARDRTRNFFIIAVNLI